MTRPVARVRCCCASREVKEVGKFYGQELNRTTYNLCRMNMILHGINYQKFDIKQEDSLEHPQHPDLRADAIVANPPFSAKWSANPLHLGDERFSLTYSKEELTLNSITLRIEACRGHITVLRGPISQVIRPALGVRCKGTTYLARHAKRRTAGIRRWIFSLLLWVRERPRRPALAGSGT